MPEYVTSRLVFIYERKKKTNESTATAITTTTITAMI